MVSFFQKYYVFWSLIAVGLIIFGIIVWEGRHEEMLILFSLPGVLLGMFLFMTNPKKLRMKKSSHDADELLKWSKLKESGAISEAEFEMKKKEILS